MANVIISPNMGLPVPITGQDPGPDWANNLNVCLSTIDGHNHSPGSGIPIVPSGLNINSDLTFQSNNATNLRSARFFSQSSPIPANPPDVGEIYVTGPDLYYNDLNGNIVRITTNGSVNSGAGSISGLPSGTASASYVSADGTFVFQQATSTASNMDIGSLILRYPGSYPTPSGNYISLQAPSSLSTGYSITLPNNVPGVNGNVLTMSSGGVLSYSVPDSIPSLQISGGTIGIANQGVTQAAMALKLVSQPVATSGNVAISEPIAFITTSNSYVDVTNATVTLTTLGRPVMVTLNNGSSGTEMAFGINGGSYTGPAGVTGFGYQWLRDGTPVETGAVSGWFTAPGSGITPTLLIPAESISFLDLVGGGTHTYQLQVINYGAGQMNVLECFVVAWEI